MPSLASPWFLLLLPLPLVAAHLLPPVQRMGGALIVPGTVSQRFQSAQSSPGQRGWLLLPACLWAALVIALAGPRVIVPTEAAPTSGREIMLALDLSGSMVTEDFELDGAKAQRIEVVKRVTSTFVRGRAGDRLALILFGSKAYFATPQTFDAEAVAHAIGQATIGISGRATGISDALGLALKRLQASDAQSKIVILLSDGVNNTGPVKPRDAAALAAKLGVRVHTIALGPDEAETAAEAQRGGVDTETLRAISRISGGTAFRVKTTDDLQKVADEIDRMEADEQDGPAAELYRDLWMYPAALAFLLSLALLVHMRRG